MIPEKKPFQEKNYLKTPKNEHFVAKNVKTKKIFFFYVFEVVTFDGLYVSPHRVLEVGLPAMNCSWIVLSLTQLTKQSTF